MGYPSLAEKMGKWEKQACFSKELALYKMQFVQYDLLYRRLTENYKERVHGGVDETVSGVGRRYKMTFKVLQLIVDGDFLTEKNCRKSVIQR